MSGLNPSQVQIRSIDSIESIDACIRLQQEVWQFPDLDIVPRRMFVVTRSVGGQIFGAWEGERLAGYAISVPGIRLGKPYLHSHMLAIAPEYRNRGIGYQLKLAQRREALERGINLIEWTFDPLQVKNAYFNLEKLGAVVRRYSENFYGASNSPLHNFQPTDRLHAEWWLKSSRVESVLSGRGLPAEDLPVTIAVTHGKHGASSDPAAATAGSVPLLLIRRDFQAAFSKGLAALRFQVDSDGGASYLLGTFRDAF